MQGPGWVPGLGHHLVAVVFAVGGATAGCSNGEKPAPQHEVVIIGAGAAGLYAAYELNRQGFDVTVIEATNRYGGRIRPLDGFGDFPIELGAEQVDGRENLTGPNPSFLHLDLVTAFPGRLGGAWTGEPGGQDGLYEMDTGNEWDWTTEDQDILDVWEWFRNIGSYDGPDITIEESLAINHGITPDHRAYFLYDVWMGGEYGTSNAHMGMYSTAKEWSAWLSGEDSYTFRTSSFLETLTQLYFDEVLDRVVFNSPVVRIETDGERPVAIDEHGARYEGDAILVTVSVAVLRDEIIEFSPALPPEKHVAINTLGMGPGMKLILRFSEPFWDTSRMYYLVADGPTDLCWTPGLRRDSGTNNILTCFIMGESAELMQSLGEDGAVTRALTDLDEMFGEEQDALPATSRFEDAFIQDWSKEPYVRGIYSFPAPGTYPMDGGMNMRDVLAAPIDDRLFFAGEATSTPHPASVHGALESGRRAAREISAVLSTEDGGSGCAAAQGRESPWLSGLMILGLILISLRRKRRG